MKIIMQILALGFFTILLSCGQNKMETEVKSDSNQVDANLKLETENINSNKYPYNLQSFILENYSILDTVSGDLNMDGRFDIIMILKKDGEDKLSDYDENQEKRPLLILIKQEDETYKLAARNDNTVYCFTCGGMMGDPYTGITIKNGFFSVEHYGGSAWRWTKIVTYKYSKEENNWFLYKDGSDSYHTSDPDNVTSEIRTVKDFGKIEFKDYDIYN